MIEILDSDEEEDSHEQPIASTSQKAVVANEFVLVNDVIMESEDETMASMNLNQNDKRNDGTEVKKEIKKPKQIETSDGDDIPFERIQVDPRI